MTTEALAEFIDSLDPDEREVINAIYWERVSVAAIAKRMQLTVGQVITLRRIAERKIKEGYQWQS